MRKRRVLIIVENLPAPFDRRVWQEARTLTAAGYEVEIICPARAPCMTRYEMLEGVRIHRHPLPEGVGAAGYALEYLVALFWQIALSLRIALARGFDVIHACNPPDTIFLVASLFKPFGVRFVFDHHDLCPELYEAKFGRRDLLWRLQVWLERRTFRAADVVISTNRSYRRIALARGGVASDRVFVVRSGPDAADWPAPASPDKAEPAEIASAGRIGYLGVMGEQEGLDLFLDAFEIVLARRPEARAVLVGDGAQRGRIAADATRRGLGEAVRLTGRLPDAEMKTALSGVDVCVNPDRPSALSDLSTMNKVIEYMALGKPIVQFEGTEGRVSARDAALYAAPGDVEDFARKVLLLLEDAPLRAEMGAAGRRRFEAELAWRHQEAGLLAAYERALARPARRRLVPSDQAVQA
jgi:glycosyltransferase involved in cell wall biosynthesis